MRRGCGTSQGEAHALARASLPAMEVQSAGCTFSAVVTIDRRAGGRAAGGGGNNPDDALQGEFLSERKQPCVTVEVQKKEVIREIVERKGKVSTFQTKCFD